MRFLLFKANTKVKVFLNDDRIKKIVDKNIKIIKIINELVRKYNLFLELTPKILITKVFLFIYEI